MKAIVLLFMIMHMGSIGYAKNYIEVQSSVQKVDLLFVIDDSGSMSVNLRTVRDQLPNLMKKYEGTSLRFLGLTTSWPETKQYFNIRNTNSATSIGFDVGLQIDFKGHYIERHYDSIISVLNDTENKNFLREEAQLVILLVSDADDQSSLSTTDFLKQLNLIKPLEMVKINSIVPVSNSCKTDMGEKTRKLIDASVITQGTVNNLCDLSWDSFSL